MFRRRGVDVCGSGPGSPGGWNDSPGNGGPMGSMIRRPRPPALWPCRATWGSVGRGLRAPKVERAPAATHVRPSWSVPWRLRPRSTMCRRENEPRARTRVRKTAGRARGRLRPVGDPRLSPGRTLLAGPGRRRVERRVKATACPVRIERRAACRSASVMRSPSVGAAWLGARPRRAIGHYPGGPPWRSPGCPAGSIGAAPTMPGPLRLDRGRPDRNRPKVRRNSRRAE